ncbi:MAG: hypothetical protein IJU62_10240 [Muribaculaceae bacterium]|nr:hypothetical protein [Muribaculaceae bacterium]
MNNLKPLFATLAAMLVSLAAIAETTVATGIAIGDYVYNINKDNSGLMIRSGINGLRVLLKGNNVIKHSYSSNSSFLRVDEGVNVTIDGAGTGTLTIEHGTQGSYAMFNMYTNSSLTIRDVPAINITCGHVVMSNGNNNSTAKLIINNSTGKFVTTSTRFSSVLLDIAEVQLVNAEIVTGRAATNKPTAAATARLSSAQRAPTSLT